LTLVARHVAWVLPCFGLAVVLWIELGALMLGGLSWVDFGSEGREASFALGGDITDFGLVMGGAPSVPRAGSWRKGPTGRLVLEVAGDRARSVWLFPLSPWHGVLVGSRTGSRLVYARRSDTRILASSAFRREFDAGPNSMTLLSFAGGPGWIYRPHALRGGWQSPEPLAFGIRVLPKSQVGARALGPGDIVSIPLGFSEGPELEAMRVFDAMLTPSPDWSAGRLVEHRLPRLVAGYLARSWTYVFDDGSPPWIHVAWRGRGRLWLASAPTADGFADGFLSGINIEDYRARVP
jgi:hypothetical protein